MTALLSKSVCLPPAAKFAALFCLFMVSLVANLLAQHLGSKNSSITTQAVLDGLNSGKNISTTLESLGLSPSEATDAQRAANRELREAERQSAASSKATSDTKPDR